MDDRDLAILRGLDELNGLACPACGAILRSYFRSSDPEDGCVKDVRWQAVAGTVGSQTAGEFEVPDCSGGVSRDSLDAGPITTGVPSAPLTLWIRGRDSWNRLEEPGPFGAKR